MIGRVYCLVLRVLAHVLEIPWHSFTIGVLVMVAASLLLLGLPSQCQGACQGKIVESGFRLINQDRSGFVSLVHTQLFHGME